MPYDEMLVRPMRQEMVDMGFTELVTAEQVDDFMNGSDGTVLIMVNSVCGCAAGMARPGARLALQRDVRPDKLGTVFAGQDLEATAQARSYFADLPPSSPSMALFKDGEMVHFIPRHHIEGQPAEAVADNLASAFEVHCVTSA